jgi:hypothetical protein
MRQIIIGQETVDKHSEFFTFSPKRQRLEYYINRGSYCSRYSFIYEDDTKLCLGNEGRNIRFNNGKAWSQTDKQREGFTYDKTTKKFKFWYKTIPNSFSDYTWVKIIKYTGNEWLEPIFYPIKSLMTATMFGKIFSKKITDPIELCKAFIKSKPWLKNSDMTPEMLHAFLISLNKKGDFLASFIPLFSIAKSVEPLVNGYTTGILNRHPYFYTELSNRCLALDLKVDFSLSKDELRDYNDKLGHEISFNYSLLTL